LDYGGLSSRTKEDICAGCIGGLLRYGVEVWDTTELRRWIMTAPQTEVAMVLDALYFQTCWYDNSVDNAVFERFKRPDRPTRAYMMDILKVRYY
jgi:hypothetical protein